jgi:hypothetical protein
MRSNDDQRRELEKIAEAVDAAVRHFRAEAVMNAALHLSPTVRPAPLAVAIEAASDDLHRLIEELA